MINRYAYAVVGTTETTNDPAVHGGSQTPHAFTPLGLPEFDPPGVIDGTDLATWDIEVRREGEHNQQTSETANVPTSEWAVLAQLSLLTARHLENGPWKAAMTLFGTQED